MTFHSSWQFSYMPSYSGALQARSARERSPIAKYIYPSHIGTFFMDQLLQICHVIIQSCKASQVKRLTFENRHFCLKVVVSKRSLSMENKEARTETGLNWQGLIADRHCIHEVYFE